MTLDECQALLATGDIIYVVHDREVCQLLDIDTMWNDEAWVPCPICFGAEPCGQCDGGFVFNPHGMKRRPTGLVCLIPLDRPITIVNIRTVPPHEVERHHAAA